MRALRLFARALRCALFGALIPGCTLPSPLNPGFRGSLGTPSDGMQTDAVELPKQGTGFARLRPWADKHWAQPRLVAALEAASAQVATAVPHSAPKMIGDLAARYGGKIPNHHSHRTGRDVDLLFYVTTLEGASVPSPGFLHFGADGLSFDAANDRYYRFDVDREWRFVKALVTSPHIGVQWMFISRELEALLIEHARALREEPELVWRAETVLLEPADSANHDDHIHLRVACEPWEYARGCEAGGPIWEWLVASPLALPQAQVSVFDSAHE